MTNETMRAALIKVRDYIENGFSDDSPHYLHDENAYLTMIDAALASDVEQAKPHCQACELRTEWDGTRHPCAEHSVESLATPQPQPAIPAAPAIPADEIGMILNEVMNLAVANGANSISMPDEYVTVAVWLASLADAPVAQQAAPEQATPGWDEWALKQARQMCMGMFGEMHAENVDVIKGYLTQAMEFAAPSPQQRDESKDAEDAAKWRNLVKHQAEIERKIAAQKALPKVHK